MEIIITPFTFGILRVLSQHFPAVPEIFNSSGYWEELQMIQELLF